MQGWRDNMLLRAPGHRDRIAHVLLAPKEGGLNLTMDAAQIDDIAERGREAAARLRRRFSQEPADGEVLTWTNHRWVRFLTFMTALEESLATFRTRAPWDLLDGRTPLPSYKVPDTLRDRFAQTTFAFADHLNSDFAGEPFQSSPKIPRPRPLLGLRPRM
jgi:hypothetical protein